MTTHSSILDWRMPWTEEPDGLQPMRSQSQAQESDNTFTFTLHLLGPGNVVSDKTAIVSVLKKHTIYDET